MLSVPVMLAVMVGFAPSLLALLLFAAALEGRLLKRPEEEAAARAREAARQAAPSAPATLPPEPAAAPTVPAPSQPPAAATFTPPERLPVAQPAE